MPDDCAALPETDEPCVPPIEVVGPVMLCQRHEAAMHAWAFGYALVHSRAFDKHVREHGWKDHRKQLLADIRRSVVYYVQRSSDGLIKIGFTTNLTNRLRTLVREFGPLVVLGHHQGHRGIERSMHKRFAADRVEGEWFTPSDALLAHVTETQKRMAAAADA